MGEFFASLWQTVVNFFMNYNLITDTVDILLVAAVIYYLIKLMRDTRAEALLKGVVVLVLLYFASDWLMLKTVHYLLQLLFDNALILIVVIFQPEIRRALERTGQSRLSFLKRFNLKDEPQSDVIVWQKAISAVCSACSSLQMSRMGALIVLERETRLAEIAATGTVIDASPSGELIGNIFFNKAPLHDGAMIIRDGKVLAAGCILPLTENRALSSELGTRHRAAVGMSENSDALVVVVSEETGTISVAERGTLRRHLSPEQLRSELENGMIWARQEAREKSLRGRRKGRKSK